jgi:hypothetical protein
MPNDPSEERQRRVERELRDLLRQCMAGVDDPFSGEGEGIVYQRWLEAIGRPAMNGPVVEEIVEWTFNDLYNKLREEEAGR